jgi:hypothetical protein
MISVSPSTNVGLAESVEIEFSESISQEFVDSFNALPSYLQQPWLDQGYNAESFSGWYYTAQADLSGSTGPYNPDATSNFSVSPSNVLSSMSWPSGETIDLIISVWGFIEGTSPLEGFGIQTIVSFGTVSPPSQAQCKATQMLIDAKSGKPVNFANH